MRLLFGKAQKIFVFCSDKIDFTYRKSGRAGGRKKHARRKFPFTGGFFIVCFSVLDLPDGFCYVSFGKCAGQIKAEANRFGGISYYGIPMLFIKNSIQLDRACRRGN